MRIFFRREFVVIENLTVKVDVLGAPILDICESTHFLYLIPLDRTIISYFIGVYRMQFGISIVGEGMNISREIVG